MHYEMIVRIHYRNPKTEESQCMTRKVIFGNIHTISTMFERLAAWTQRHLETKGAEEVELISYKRTQAEIVEL